MRHHTTSIVGPDIDESNCPATPDSCHDHYHSDVLAACPMAREWNVHLDSRTVGFVPFVWVDGGRNNHWCPRTKKWTPILCYGPGEHGNRKSALANPPTTPPPGYVAPPAQPSVGDELGRVLTANMHGSSPWTDLSEPQKEGRRVAALAVRREVLKEVFAEEDVEAAAKAMWNATLPGITWDELREASRKPIWVQAAATLSAALASRVARESKVTP